MCLTTRVSRPEIQIVASSRSRQRLALANLASPQEFNAALGVANCRKEVWSAILSSPSAVSEWHQAGHVNTTVGKNFPSNRSFEFAMFNLKEDRWIWDILEYVVWGDIWIASVPLLLIRSGLH